MQFIVISLPKIIYMKSSRILSNSRNAAKFFQSIPALFILSNRHGDCEYLKDKQNS